MSSEWKKDLFHMTKILTTQKGVLPWYNNDYKYQHNLQLKKRTKSKFKENC